MSELSEQLSREDAELRFADFTVEDAWLLGSRMRAAAVEQGLPVVIGIVLGQQRVFHSLPSRKQPLRSTRSSALAPSLILESRP